MPSEEKNAAVYVLKALVADLKHRLAHPEHYTEREREHQRMLLQARRLELADLIDQENDPGDLP